MAFRTVSKACITTLTSIEPLHTHLQNKQLTFQVKHNTHTLHPNTSLKDLITNNITQSLQIRHTDCNDTFKAFFPTLPIPKHIIPYYYTTQFYTGHGHYLAYLHRFNHSNTPYCTCSNTPQTATHLLLGV